MGYNSNVDDLLPPEENDEDLNKSFIFPHSVMVSAEPVLVRSAYFDLWGKSKFTVYLNISSVNENSDYIANIHILDIMLQVPDYQRTFYFKSLQGEDYLAFINNYFGLIFRPFKRQILNFEKGKISMREYLDVINDWLKNNPPV